MIWVFFKNIFQKKENRKIREEWIELQQMLHEEQRLQKSIENRAAAKIVSRTIEGKTLKMNLDNI